MWSPCAQDPKDVADAVKRSRAGLMVAFEDRTLVLQKSFGIAPLTSRSTTHTQTAFPRAQEAAERRSFQTTNSSPSALTRMAVRNSSPEAEGTGLEGLMANAPTHVPSQPRNVG